MKKKADFFADMAELDAKQRGQLVRHPCPERQQKTLPLRPSSGKERLPQEPRAEVRYECAMKALRRWAVPFLRNCVPALEEIRSRIALTRFQWRMETEQDLRDAMHPLNGEGAWKRVTIPHFGGPIGRAAAYYRCEFSLTAKQIKDRSLFVCFKGVDYKAHVFVNGRYLGSNEGFFAPFEFDFSRVARPGRNTLLVRVENDHIMMGNRSWGDELDGDKLYAATGPGWDNPDCGWCHCPPGMGIYQPVSIESRAPVHVKDVFVRPLSSLAGAELWLEVHQARVQQDFFSVAVSVHGFNFKGVAMRRRVLGERIPADPGVNYFRFKLELKNTRIWSPESPWLYQVQVELLDADGGVLDRSSGTFGMRTFSMETAESPFGRFFLNGSELKLRGTNTMGFEQQDVMKGAEGQLLEDLLMAKGCGLNFLRLTQRPVQKEIYDLCDRLGLMTQTDLPLFGLLRRNQFAEAVRQAGEMERLVRAHPCNIMVTFINEPFPPSLRGKEHRHLARHDLERFFDAAAHHVLICNPDRVIKPADGDYDPPAEGLPDTHCYTLWYNGHEVAFGDLYRGEWCAVKKDWMYGCGEFGAEGLDPAGLMLRRYPKAWLPQKGRERDWSPLLIHRAQVGQFYGFFYDRPEGLEDWAAASQRYQAWAMKMMIEAFRRDNRMVSFAVHHFIDAFPAGWMKAVVDCEREPKPAFFAVRDALCPLLVTLRCDRWSGFSGEEIEVEVWVSNDTSVPSGGAAVEYQTEIDGKVLARGEVRVEVHPWQSICPGAFRIRLPEVPMRGTLGVYAVLRGADGQILSSNRFECRVFARPESERSPVVVLDRNGGLVKALLDELGIDSLKTASWPRNAVVLIGDMTIYERQKEKVDRHVQKGGRVVFYRIPEGEWGMGDRSVCVAKCVRNSRVFVSRKTGHQLVSGFEPNDFAWWLEGASGRISSFLSTYLRADGWDPVLLTVDQASDGQWVHFPAVAAAAWGAGEAFVCQLELNGRLMNPVCRIFLERMLGLH